MVVSMIEQQQQGLEASGGGLLLGGSFEQVLREEAATLAAATSSLRFLPSHPREPATAEAARVGAWQELAGWLCPDGGCRG